MSGLFDAVREVSAVDAAERAGVQLVRHGGGLWCACPIHGERTASLKFYGDTGGWYCFGCGKGGDAVRLYEEMYHVEAVEAARMLAAAFGIRVDESLPAGPLPKPEPGNRQKERAADAAFNRVWGEVCGRKWEAGAVLRRLEAEGTADWENPLFVAALTVFARADERLAALDCWGAEDKRDLLMRGGVPGGPERSGRHS